jgi:hypothetical protein
MTIQSITESRGDLSASSYDSRPAPNRRTFTETRNGFKTSEFWVMLAFVVAVLLATYADEDSLARDDGWLFAAFAVVAYLVSRGLAKLVTREPYVEDGRDVGRSS